jgi:hypothetical protein
MAHFAELETKVDPTGFTSDTHQVVKRVVVVGNDITAGDGVLGNNDMHVDGETWCINFFKTGIWKQTSYNNNFRKQYAGIGMVYDPVKDKFIEQQPHASWSLDENDDWLNQTIHRIHLPNTIGMAQLGCPNRRLIWLIEQDQQMVV